MKIEMVGLLQYIYLWLGQLSIDVDNKTCRWQRFQKVGESLPRGVGGIN
jgi:hypothetical protein